MGWQERLAACWAGITASAPVLTGLFGAVALLAVPAAAQSADSSAARVPAASFGRLAPGAVLGSAAGMLAGWGTSVALYRSTGCCVAATSEDGDLGQRFVLAAVGGVAGTAIGTWLAGGRGRHARLATALRGAAAGVLPAVLLAAAGGGLADHFGHDPPYAGYLIGGSIGQGVFAAWVTSAEGK